VDGVWGLGAPGTAGGSGRLGPFGMTSSGFDCAGPGGVGLPGRLGKGGCLA
jgi:hypothetical protein